MSCAPPASSTNDAWLTQRTPGGCMTDAFATQPSYHSKKRPHSRRKSRPRGPLGAAVLPAGSLAVDYRPLARERERVQSFRIRSARIGFHERHRHFLKLRGRERQDFVYADPAAIGLGAILRGTVEVALVAEERA